MVMTGYQLSAYLPKAIITTSITTIITINMVRLLTSRCLGVSAVCLSAQGRLKLGLWDINLLERKK